MTILLDFSREQFPYLASAYAFVVASMGFYLFTLSRREREVERLRRRHLDGDG